MKKVGKTSVEAAQEFLDTQWNEQNTLNLDALQRAHLRRMMGFDFEVKVRPNKYHISSRQEPYVTTWCKFTGVVDEAFVDRLVDACLRLKIKYEAQVAKEKS